MHFTELEQLRLLFNWRFHQIQAFTSLNSLKFRFSGFCCRQTTAGFKRLLHRLLQIMLLSYCCPFLPILLMITSHTCALWSQVLVSCIFKQRLPPFLSLCVSMLQRVAPAKPLNISTHLIVTYSIFSPGFMSRLILAGSHQFKLSDLNFFFLPNFRLRLTSLLGAELHNLWRWVNS